MYRKIILSKLTPLINLIQIFKESKSEWNPILLRAVEFCRQSTHVITGPHAKHLHLVSMLLIIVYILHSGRYTVLLNSAERVVQHCIIIKSYFKVF